MSISIILGLLTDEELIRLRRRAEKQQRQEIVGLVQTELDCRDYGNPDSEQEPSENRRAL